MNLHFFTVAIAILVLNKWPQFIHCYELSLVMRNAIFIQKVLLMIIYADLILIINMIMNSIVLWLTAAATGIRVNTWRIGFAAFIGSVYVLIGVYPDLSALYSLPAKIIVSGILVFLAFGYTSLRLLLFQIGAFYLVSFVIGGAVLGWMFFFEDQVWSGKRGTISIPASYLIVGSAIGITLVILFGRRCVSRMYRKKTLHTLRIDYAGRQAVVTALLDTGNGLYTVVGRKPVVPVELEALSTALSAEASQFLFTHLPQNWLNNLELCQDADWLSRIEVVPYRAVGAADILLAFRPDSMTVWVGGRAAIITNGAIAIYGGKISGDGRYQALLHPDIFLTAQHEQEANLCA